MKFFKKYNFPDDIYQKKFITNSYFIYLENIIDKHTSLTNKKKISTSALINIVCLLFMISSIKFEIIVDNSKFSPWIVCVYFLLIVNVLLLILSSITTRKFKESSVASIKAYFWDNLFLFLSIIFFFINGFIITINGLFSNISNNTNLFIFLMIILLISITIIIGRSLAPKIFIKMVLLKKQIRTDAAPYISLLSILSLTGAFIGANSGDSRGGLIIIFSLPLILLLTFYIEYSIYIYLLYNQMDHEREYLNAFCSDIN